MEPPPGYRLLAEIARGGMAEVYLAERAGAEGVSKIVALKWLLPHLAHDAEFVRMFKNEARIAIDLSHANVVSTIELGESSGRYYLAMEYVRGHDLARVLQASQGNPMPAPVAVLVAADVAKGLAYAHERAGASGASLGIVHRDVSPANVLVSLEGEVKLADFGVARAAAHASATSQGWVKGKIPYMSPEQARGEPLDARSDLYALGILLYEMLTARRWFSGKDDVALLADVRRAKAPTPEELDGVPPEIAAILVQALAPDRDQRFQSARELGKALSRALAQLGAVSSEDLRQHVATLGLSPPLDPARVRGPSGTLRSPEKPAVPVRAPPKTPLPPPPVPPRTKVLVAAAAGLSAALLAAAATGGARWALRGAVARAPSHLEVRSRPAGARVHVAGVDRGATPLVLDDLGPGPLEVRVEAPGRAALVERVDFGAHPSVVLDATLSPVEDHPSE